MSRQLPLFDLPEPEMFDPLTLLRNGAALVLSVSGGKDSDAMSHYLINKCQREGWTGEVFMLHAELHSADWKQTPAYVREFANRMLTAPGSASYAYDGDGNRISQTVSSVVTDYLLDTQTSLAKVIKASDGTNTDHYLHSPRGIHATDNGTDWRYTMQDGLGSVRGWVNSAGSVSGIVNYTPHGVPDAPVDEFGFTGEQTNGNGLLYLRARHYNPNIAIMTALDPFEGTASRPMSLNGYLYVEGQVINATDPSGHSLLLASVLNGGSCREQSSNESCCPPQPPRQTTSSKIFEYCNCQCKDRWDYVACMGSCDTYVTSGEQYKDPNIPICQDILGLSRCRIEIASYRAGLPLSINPGYSHAFILFYDMNGNVTEFRGGPDFGTGSLCENSGDGLVCAQSEPHGAGVRSGGGDSADYNGGIYRERLVLEGPEVCDIESCLIDQIRQINNRVKLRNVEYCGPVDSPASGMCSSGNVANSNTVAFTLADQCNISGRTSGFLPGWGLDTLLP